MPEIQIKDSMKYFLLDGPIGIGEDHTSPNARDFIDELIEAGHVKRLFVEYPTGWQADVDRLKAAISTDPMDEDEVRRLILSLYYRQQYHCDAHPLAVLIGDALMAGVDVWCADHWVGGGSARFPTRHQSVRRTYIEKTRGTSAKGSVILFGSFHFTDPNAGLDQYIHNLPYYVF
ncbi:hypothetical protein ACJ5NV_13185 [Loktanella agnita]|uniref:hypothetical protein n=1 Tax=Loktanella agnita TaxID=287097 RepID=UPI003985D1D4